MIKRLFILSGLMLSASIAQAQDAVPASTTSAPPIVNHITLTRDTPVSLMAINEVSTANVSPGTRFKLRVHQPIIVDGATIIPVGTLAYGEVVTATGSGGLGKSGTMTARLLHIQLGNAEIPLEGDTSAKGTGAGSAGIAVIFAGVSGLFHRGNNAKIKAGELLNGFVREDVVLNLDASPIARIVPIKPN